MEARPTLGIKSGEDLLDIDDELQLAFDIQFDEPETKLETVGELHDYIARKLHAAPRGSACSTLVSFNKLRSGLSAFSQVRVAPSTPLTAFGLPARPLLHRLHLQTKLEMPSYELTWLGLLGTASLLAGFVYLIISLGTRVIDIPYAVLIFGAGIAALAIDPGVWPRNCRTVGQLSQLVARRNVTRLGGMGARVGSTEIWDAIVDILEGRAVVTSGAITRETRFT